MKRDMDLVRKILFAMEATEKPTHRYTDTHPVKVEGYDQDTVHYHMKIMEQAGLLHVDRIELPPNPHIRVEMPKQYTSYYSISWNGHEFLDAARDNKRWEKAKSAMAQVGGFVFDVGKQLLIQYLKAELLSSN